MKCFFFSCMIILCPCLVGAQSFPYTRMYPFNPGSYAADSGQYLEAQVKWILPVAGMQDVHAEAGLSWKNARWIGRIQHFGDALYREGSVGLVWAKREGKVRLGAGVDYRERRIGNKPEQKYMHVDLGMWAKLFPQVELGLHGAGPASSYLHVASKLYLSQHLLVLMDGIWQTQWFFRGGLMYRIRPRIWFFSFVSTQTLSLGLALKSSTYGMLYGIETRPYAAYGHQLGIRYERYP